RDQLVPGAERAICGSARIGISTLAAARTGTRSATARVAVARVASSKLRVAYRSHTTTATTAASPPRRSTTGRIIRDATSMFVRRWTRCEAASVTTIGWRRLIAYTSSPGGRAADASARGGRTKARSAPTSAARGGRLAWTPWATATLAHTDGRRATITRLTRPFTAIASTAATAPEA